jgi:hypothetical protein
MKAFKAIVVIMLIGSLSACGASVSKGLSHDEICRGAVKALAEGNSILANIDAVEQISKPKVDALIAKIQTLQAGTTDSKGKQYLAKLIDDYGDLKNPQKAEAALNLLVWDAVNLTAVCKTK